MRDWNNTMGRSRMEQRSTCNNQQTRLGRLHVTRSRQQAFNGRPLANKIIKGWGWGWMEVIHQLTNPSPIFFHAHTKNKAKNNTFLRQSRWKQTKNQTSMDNKPPLIIVRWRFYPSFSRSLRLSSLSPPPLSLYASLLSLFLPPAPMRSQWLPFSALQKGCNEVPYPIWRQFAAFWAVVTMGTAPN